MHVSLSLQHDSVNTVQVVVKVLAPIIHAMRTVILTTFNTTLAGLNICLVCNLCLVCLFYSSYYQLGYISVKYFFEQQRKTYSSFQSRQHPHIWNIHLRKRSSNLADKFKLFVPMSMMHGAIYTSVYPRNSKGINILHTLPYCDPTQLYSCLTFILALDHNRDSDTHAPIYFSALLLSWFLGFPVPTRLSVCIVHLWCFS